MTLISHAPSATVLVVENNTTHSVLSIDANRVNGDKTTNLDGETVMMASKIEPAYSLAIQGSAYTANSSAKLIVKSQTLSSGSAIVMRKSLVSLAAPMSHIAMKSNS